MTTITGAVIIELDVDGHPVFRIQRRRVRRERLPDPERQTVRLAVRPPPTAPEKLSSHSGNSTKPPDNGRNATTSGPNKRTSLTIHKYPSRKARVFML